MNILFAYATVTGTAKLVCDALIEAAKNDGHKAQLSENLTPDQWIDSAADLLILVTANTGAGEIPPALSQFYTGVCDDYPRIAGLKYTIVNLGDSSFVSFAEAGMKLNAALEDLGAQAINEGLVIDAMTVTDHESEATNWFKSEVLTK